MYREHDPSRESVEHIPFPVDCEAAGDQILTLVACGDGLFCKVVAPLVAVAHLEFAEDGVSEAPLTEVREAEGHPLVAVEEVLYKLLGGILGDNEHALALILFGEFLGGDLLLLNLNMVFLCQPAERLGVREVLVFHDEVDCVAALAAAEALEYALGGRNCE